jgi:hypothetical protein
MDGLTEDRPGKLRIGALNGHCQPPCRQFVSQRGAAAGVTETGLRSGIDHEKRVDPFGSSCG